MGTYEDLKAAIQQVIRTNGNNEITGQILQESLLSIINNIGRNAGFAGIATPTTSPIYTDSNIIYLATTPGDYPNFDGVSLYPGELAILANGSGTWTKYSLGSLASNYIEILYDELVDLRNNKSLVPGRLYRITDYITTTTQENTRTAGKMFDIIVLALSESELSEQAWAVQSARDTDGYFANSKLSAWKIWYSLDNDTERFAWDDTANGKGVIYRMIDEWDNDCPYDFKNIQFNRGVYYGGGIAPEGDEDMNFYLFTFSFRTGDNEIIDTSIFGNNGRLLNDEGQISGVYGNVIGPYMSYDGSIANPTKTTQRLNDIVFFSHYDYEGGIYYGCNSNSFGNYCYRNSFGNSCYRNSFGDGCYNNSFGNSCYNNSFGNICYNNSFGDFCESNGFGDFCSNNSFGNYCSNNSFGNSCSNNSFGNSCYNNSFGNYCSNNSFGDFCESNSFGNSCSNNSFGNYYRYNKVDDGVRSVELSNSQTASYNQQVKNYHLTRGLSSQTIAVERNRAYETTVAVDSAGNVKQFCIADLAQ